MIGSFSSFCASSIPNIHDKSEANNQIGEARLLHQEAHSCLFPKHMNHLTNTKQDAK
jgi:hypothetical protein